MKQKWIAIALSFTLTMQLCNLFLHAAAPDAPEGAKQDIILPPLSETIQESIPAERPTVAEAPEQQHAVQPEITHEDAILWDFENGAQGWSGNIRMESPTVENAIITFVSLGSNETREPSVYSPVCPENGNGSADTQKVNTLKIRLRNQTGSTKLYFYYTTYAPEHGNFNSNKRIALPVEISDEFIEYRVDFRTEDLWQNSFKQFMITMGGADGALSIDYAYLTYEDYGWDFNDHTTQGWTGNVRTSGVAASAQGTLTAGLLGNGDNREPALYSSDKMPVILDNYHKVRIRVKNCTNADTLYFYYTTRTDGETAFHSGRRVSVPVTPQSDEFTEYVINFYNEEKWKGTFKQFMITAGDAVGTLEIDEVIFEKMQKTDYAHWNFDDSSLEGWRVTDDGTGTPLHSLSVENGCLKIVRNAEGYGSVFTPDGMNLETYCHYLVLGVKAAYNTPGISAYFKAPDGTYQNNDTSGRVTYMKHQKLAESNTAAEYVIDLADAAPGWRSGYEGTIDELMFLTTGTIYLDYVYLTPDPFTKVTRTESFEIGATAGKTYYALVTESAWGKDAEHTYTVEYDPTVLEITDLCAFTWAKDLEVPGTIPGTGVNVVSHIPGTLVFRTHHAGNQFFRRLVNVVEFKALNNGLTEVFLKDGI